MFNNNIISLYVWERKGEIITKYLLVTSFASQVRYCITSSMSYTFITCLCFTLISMVYITVGICLTCMHMHIDTNNSRAYIFISIVHHSLLFQNQFFKAHKHTTLVGPMLSYTIVDQFSVLYWSHTRHFKVTVPIILIPDS